MYYNVRCDFFYHHFTDLNSQRSVLSCQVPIQVATKLASIRKPTLLAPSPEAYARAAVRCIGYEPRCTPYWPHALLWLLISLVPEPVADRMILNVALDVRAKGRAKDTRKKKA